MVGKAFLHVGGTIKYSQTLMGIVKSGHITFLLNALIVDSVFKWWICLKLQFAEKTEKLPTFGDSPNLIQN
jgi:hypothetical protein